jgi:hypothetical protein
LSPTHPTASNPGLPARPMASYHGSAP